MDTKKFEKLIVKYWNNSISQKEWEDLNTWLEKSKDSELFKDYVKINYAIEDIMSEFNTKRIKESVLRKIKKDKNAEQRLRISMMFKYAAILILTLTTSYFIWNATKATDPILDEVKVVVSTEILPGTNKAILELDNGSEINLGGNSLVQTSNAKSNGKEIIYKKKSATTQKLMYNTLTIPRGGQYVIELADGTKVWMNSDSKLKYPVSFIEGKIREVELVYGEAYFDVSPSSNHKGTEFKVFNEGQEIKVLGTEFNVKAYKDEKDVYTTLVEGKVLVTYNDLKQELAPSQQSRLNTKNNLLMVKTVDVYNEISWRNGVFSFEDKTLKEIMTILSRWYDMDVVFKNKSIENESFVGVIGKDDNIRDILDDIKSFGIIKNYEINEREVVLE